MRQSALVRLDDVRAIEYGGVLFEGEPWPSCIHVVEHPEGRILVDTGMIDSTPELDEEWHPFFDAGVIPRDVAFVVNTHLHFDHCGGNRLFTGTPIYVQRVEREAAREPGYTVPEWVEFQGARYLELEGEAEVADGVRVIRTPGHTDGHQSVLVETEDGLVVVGGDVAYTWQAFDEPANSAARQIEELRPRRIWLAHQREPRDLD
jgi:N-acyl homoserine lactone hydrolase